MRNMLLHRRSESLIQGNTQLYPPTFTMVGSTYMIDNRHELTFA